MLEYIIPGLCTIVVAVIEAIAAKDRKAAKESSEKHERRQQQREKAERLQIRMQNATLQLSIVSANALTGGHNNGNVERARAAAESAQAEYDAFINELAAREIAK